MKILLASYFDLPHVGGLWTYVRQLEARLRELGHDVDIFARGSDPASYRMLTDGRSVEASKMIDPISRNLTAYYEKERPDIPEWVRRREIERYAYEAAAIYFGLGDYDVIHAQDIVSSRALWRVKPKRTPLVATLHSCLATAYLETGEVNGRDSKEWIYAAKEEYYGALSNDVALVPSHWLRRMLHHEFGVPNSHVHVIPYGLDLSSYAEAAVRPSDFVRPPGKAVIVCPARLVPAKGHAALLQSLARLRQERDDWECWIVGDGPLRGALQAETERLGLQAEIRFLGDRDDAPALIRLADVVVMPSLLDHQPYSIMEAQIAGKPVVASDAGGIPEMIRHGDTGFLFPKGDSDALCRQLSNALYDKALAKVVGQRAMLWGQSHWSLDRRVGETLLLYRQLVNGS